MADVNGPVCLNHPDTPAVNRCAACGKAICEACTVSRESGCYCSNTCADNAERSQLRVNTALDGKKRADSKAKKRLFTGILLILVILAGLYFWHIRNQGENKSFLKQVGKNLDSSLKSSRNTIQKSIPRNSNYKKNREDLVK